MEVQVVLSSDDIIRGLKHYRRIAKQDVLRAPETENPESFLRHAEARRAVYAELTAIAEKASPREVAQAALEAYRSLPFVAVDEDPDHVDVRGRENAFENFFLMIGLEPKLRREARNQRPALGTDGTDASASDRDDEEPGATAS